VVEREHVLIAVRGDPPFAEHEAGVVHEHVDALQPGQSLSQSAHLPQAGEVGDLRPRRRCARRTDFSSGRLGPAAVAPDQDDRGAQPGQSGRRRLPDPGRRACHHANRALHARMLAQRAWPGPPRRGLIGCHTATRYWPIRIVKHQHGARNTLKSHGVDRSMPTLRA
jgi:hypothetical protein